MSFSELIPEFIWVYFIRINYEARWVLLKPLQKLESSNLGQRGENFKQTKQQKQVPSKVAVIKYLLKTEALVEMENKAFLTVWSLKRKRELQKERRYDWIELTRVCECQLGNFFPRHSEGRSIPSVTCFINSQVFPPMFPAFITPWISLFL